MNVTRIPLLHRITVELSRFSGGGQLGHKVDLSEGECQHRSKHLLAPGSSCAMKKVRVPFLFLSLFFSSPTFSLALSLSLLVSLSLALLLSFLCLPSFFFFFSLSLSFSCACLFVSHSLSHSPARSLFLSFSLVLFFAACTLCCCTVHTYRACY